MKEEEDVVKRSKNCLTIRGSDYILEQIDDTSLMFDLKLLRTVHGKNGIDREEFKLEAYGLPMDIAFWRVVMYHQTKGNTSNEDKEMVKFIKEFKKASNFLGREFKRLYKPR